MMETLNTFLELDGEVINENSDSFFYEIKLDNSNISFLKDLYEKEFIENIKTIGGQLVNIGNLASFIDQLIVIEFVSAELRKIGYYLNRSEFIRDNRFEIPALFYVKELNYLSSSDDFNEEIEKYKTITSLIDRLVSKAKFISDEHDKVLYLVQDNSFLELPIGNEPYEDHFENKNIDLVKQYIESIDSYKEKKVIFFKELIDSLSNKPKTERFSDLVLGFVEFFERCNTSFEYYLSNFSFSKIKLELDNSVLEYSKSIRAIINDSQSRLIAIPAAFILGVSQINYTDPLGIRNILIAVSAFLFSYIISIFIMNQRNALEIIKDNVKNYKINYGRSKTNQLENERELESLSALIDSSYRKIEDELDQQRERLKILQLCNWGVSVALFSSLFLVVYFSDIKQLWNKAFLLFFHCA